jgi:hypothetical protein
MATPYRDPGIDEYLRKRLMPVEGVIPHLPGVEMYGNSIPAGTDTKPFWATRLSCASSAVALAGCGGVF